MDFLSIVGLISIISISSYLSFKLFKGIGKIQGATPNDDAGWAIYYLLFLFLFGLPSLLFGGWIAESSHQEQPPPTEQAAQPCQQLESSTTPTSSATQ